MKNINSLISSFVFVTFYTIGLLAMEDNNLGDQQSYREMLATDNGKILVKEQLRKGNDLARYLFAEDYTKKDSLNLDVIDFFYGIAIENDTNSNSIKDAQRGMAYYMAGLANFGKGNNDKAIKYLQLGEAFSNVYGLVLSMQMAFYALTKSDVNYDQRDFDLVNTFLGKLENSNKQDQMVASNIYFAVANYYIAKGRYNEAWRYLRRAQIFNVDNAYLDQTMANLHIRSGDFSAACCFFQCAGHVFYKQGNINSSCKCYFEAAKLMYEIEPGSECFKIYFKNFAIAEKEINWQSSIPTAEKKDLIDKFKSVFPDEEFFGKK